MLTSVEPEKRAAKTPSGPPSTASIASSPVTMVMIRSQRWARALIETEKEGVAVCFTSSHSSRETPGLSHSSASKNGVQSLIRSMSREWGRFGLRLSMIGPGCFPEEDMHHTENWEVTKTRERLLNRIALGRFGKLHEIVGPTLFLLSRSGTYVTGENLIVDGGIRLLDWTVAPGDRD